jgi:hypothetical protein
MPTFPSPRAARDDVSLHEFRNSYPITPKVSNEMVDEALSNSRARARMSMAELHMLASAHPSLDDDRPVATQMLPHLPILLYKLSALRSEEDPGYVDFQWRLAMLPYALTAAYAAYVRFSAAAQAIVQKHGESFESARLTLAATDTYEMCFAIDAFLDSGRRAQNALTAHLSAATRRSLPQSLPDLMSGMAKEKFQLPSGIAKMLADYWSKHGKRLKEYRDLSQHHILVASHTTLFRGERRAIGLHVLLPSNPDAASTKDFVWGDPPVHAQLFLKHQLAHLLTTAYRLTKVLAESLPGAQRQLLGFHPRTPIEFGKQVGGFLPATVAAIDAYVRAILRAAENAPLPPVSV